MKTLIIILLITTNLQAQINLAKLPDSGKSAKVSLMFVGGFIIAGEGLKIANNEFESDKINHFAVGYMIAFAGNAIGYKISDNKTVGLISGILLSSATGILKERYDKNNGGIFNKEDLKATVLGGITGSITVRLVLWNSISEKKFYDRY